MTSNKAQGINIIIISFVVGFILSMVPLPQLLHSVRPEFVAIVLIYWCIALPNRVGVGVGWVCGLFYDVTTDALLGQHALTFAIIAFLSIQLHQRIRVFPLWQQALTVFLFMTFQGAITLWITGMLDDAPSLWTVLLPSISTAAVWPVGYLVMRQVRRVYQVS